MRLNKKKKPSGFTLFEMIVVIALIGTLATLAFGRFRGLQEAAEQASVEANISALRAALLIRSTELVVGNRWAEMEALYKQNPFSLLEIPPGNYLGELNGPPQPGNWYYLPKETSVMYAVGRGEGFLASTGERSIRLALIGMNALGYPVVGNGVAYVSLKTTTAIEWNGRNIR